MQTYDEWFGIHSFFSVYILLLPHRCQNNSYSCINIQEIEISRKQIQISDVDSLNISECMELKTKIKVMGRANWIQARLNRRMGYS
jgi:hypothetical protein